MTDNPPVDPAPDNSAPEDDGTAPVRPDEVDPGSGGDLAALMGGGGGGFDFGSLLEQATAMQAQMAEAQERAAAAEVEGVAGGGVVKVTVTGTMEFRSVTISPEVVDPADTEMLEDLVLAALHHAVEQVQELQNEGAAALDLGGLDLGGLMGGDS